ncbi:hypothetical protein C8J57DRAFT_1223242 [Mycena rebaudengoi]|nr:hypothetical protein C8J57DRAFT_1223242 [Mycena rebaudengoi]
MISAKTSACIDLLREYQHKGRGGLGKCDVCKVDRSGTTGRQAAERTCHHNVLWNGHDTDAEDLTCSRQDLLLTRYSLHAAGRLSLLGLGWGLSGAGVEQPGSVPRPVELDVDVGVPGVVVVHSHTSRHPTHTRGRGAKSNGNNSRSGSLWECPQFAAKFRDAQIALRTWILLSSFSHATRVRAADLTIKSLFQLVCEIFGGLGGQGERMGGRGTHPDSPPAETRLIAPNVAGSADCAAQMEKAFKSSRRLELAENGGMTTRKK